MNRQRPQFNSKRLLRTAIAGAALALLAACGGGGSSSSSGSSSTPSASVNLQVVSFGDSLSDVGTYSPNIALGFGGGKFTTNPGEIWVQKVAEYFGGTITPAYEGGFGLALSATGGLGYAQGGADVSVAEGEGWAANNAAATTVPVVTQVQNYLSAHSSFNSNQLVLVNGGANDIFQSIASTSFLQSVEQAVATATTANGGALTQTQTVEVIAQAISSTQVGEAAVTLAQTVGTILQNGATHVAVMNVPDIGNTPLGVSQNAASPGAAALLSGITAAYNAILEQALASQIAAGKVVWVDSFSFIDETLANYQANGFSVSNTATACNLTEMAANATAYATANPSVLSSGETAAEYGSQFASSLFCSPETLVSANAPQTYMFADSVHPTTGLHALFAQYVEKQLATAGIGG
jgi:phospholipase/lecithinase/hemolysin